MHPRKGGGLTSLHLALSSGTLSDCSALLDSILGLRVGLITSKIDLDFDFDFLFSTRRVKSVESTLSINFILHLSRCVTTHSHLGVYKDGIVR